MATVEQSVYVANPVPAAGQHDDHLQMLCNDNRLDHKSEKLGAFTDDLANYENNFDRMDPSGGMFRSPPTMSYYSQQYAMPDSSLHCNTINAYNYATAKKHGRRNSCGSSTSGDLKNGKEHPVQTAEAVSEFQYFLDAHYKKCQNDPAYANQQMNRIARTPSGSFHLLQRNVTGEKPVFQRKMSNPLRGALAAAMAASSTVRNQHPDYVREDSLRSPLSSEELAVNNSPRDVIEVGNMDSITPSPQTTGQVEYSPSNSRQQLDSRYYLNQESYNGHGHYVPAMQQVPHSVGFSRGADMTEQDYNAFFGMNNHTIYDCDKQEWAQHFLEQENAFKEKPKRTTKHRGPRGSSSSYRGVTQHKRTGRWEAHVWDQGKQVYLGGFETEERAGRAYDVVAVKCRGMKAETNFPMSEYQHILPYLQCVSRDELVALLRRRSKGFSRGTSRYTGVTKHKCGKWEARISNKEHIDGRKYTYLGLFEAEVAAARAHDRAAVAMFGFHAHTNFDMTLYHNELALHNPGKKEMNMLKLFEGINSDIMT